MMMAKHMRQRAGGRRLISATRLFVVGGAAGVVALGTAGGVALASGGDTPLGVQTTGSSHAAVPAMSGDGHGVSPDYHASVQLQAMPTGTVTLRRSGDVVDADISAFGLTPGSTHVAVLSSPGARSVVFSPFTASATGQVDTTVAAVLPHHPHHHASWRDATFHLELSTSPGQPIAVARVLGDRFDGGAQFLQAVEPHATSPLAGYARLTYDSLAETLTVDVHASGFAPNSTHAAHIHQGSCAVQGNVLTMLPDLHAGWRGDVNQRVVIHDVASFTTPVGGWYLNIHEGSSATILDAAGNPTIAFRPLLCGNLPPSAPVGHRHGRFPGGSPRHHHAPTPRPGSGPIGSTGAPGAPSSEPPTAPGAGSPSSPAGQNGAPVPAVPSAGAPGQTAPAQNTPGTPDVGTPVTPTAPSPAAPAPASPEPAQILLAAGMHPVGSNLNAGSAEFFLRPPTGRVCVNLELFNVGGHLPGTIVNAQGDPVATFSFLGVSDGGFRSACSAVDAAAISQIAANPGAYQFAVPVPGTATRPAQTDVGTLHALGS